MTNQLTNFNYEGHDVRTVSINGNPWWILKDVCEVLDLTSPHKVAERLDEDEKGRSLIPTLGGEQELTVVSESGLYNVILRSDKPEARKFKRWVTHDVLPSIRKHGLYAADDLLDDPDLFIRALTELKEVRARNTALAVQVGAQERQIAEMRPKAGYFDVVLACKDAVAISVIAKDYGWSAKHMNTFLHEKGVQFRQGRIWLLYQKYAGHGYACSRTHEHTGRGGEPHATVHTYWTQKGRLFLYGLLKDHGVLPLVEQGVAPGA